MTLREVKSEQKTGIGTRKRLTRKEQDEVKEIYKLRNLDSFPWQQERQRTKRKREWKREGKKVVKNEE